MASPNNHNPPPPTIPFDMHSFFNPQPPPPPSSNPNPNPNHNPSSSYPPPFHFPNFDLPLPPHPHHRSISFPTQPIPPPSNPNAGARLMTLLGNTSPAPPQPPPLEFVPFSSSAVLAAASAASPALTRLPSSKVPKGRHLAGELLTYDVDVSLPGEVQPQLEAAPITKYGSDPNPVLGRQIAVNKSYICYGLKQGNIRVLNIHTAVRSLLRGHTQRVTDLAFFAEDVHLLASVGTDGRVYVWKITEGPDDEDKPQITSNIVIALQIVGEEKVEHPQICWHCHKQEILIVGMGKHVLRIDTTKVGNGEAFVVDDPLRCPVDKLIDGVQLVGTHDGEVTDLSMCQWMTNQLVSASQDGTIKIWEDRKTQPLAILRPHDGNPVFSATFFTAPHQPDHIVLITAGPQNREVKLWVSASDKGWVLPSDTESWKCTQTLELKSSAQPSMDAFFNQVAALSHAAGLLLLANAQRNAIYAVHLEYGSNPESTRMDYIAEFTVTMPILSFTGTSDILPHGEHIVQVYCVQTQAIQQYALDLAQCLPPPYENVGLENSDSSVSRDPITVEGFHSLDSSAGRTTEMSLASSAPKTMLQTSSNEGGLVARYPLSSGHVEAPISRGISSSNTEAKPATLRSVSLSPRLIAGSSLVSSGLTMEAIVKKFQSKFRKVREAMSRWDKLQSCLISQFRNAFHIVDRLQVLQNSNNYGVLNCASGMKDALLVKQIESLRNILVSMRKTLEEFHCIVLSLDKIHHDSRQQVKGGSCILNMKQLQQQIGIKPSLIYCLDSLMFIHEIYNSEYLLKSSVISALSEIALKPSDSDLGALQQLLVDQPNLQTVEVQFVFDVIFAEELS